MGLLTSFTRNTAGGGQLWPLPVSGIFGAAAAAWPSANQGIFVKFRLSTGHLITGLQIGVGTASGNAKAGLYTSDGTTITQVALSASTAVAGTNDDQQIPFATAYQGVPFQDYFAFLAVDNTTATVARLTMVSGSVSAGFGITYAASTVFSTPPTSEAISNLSAPSTGYTPTILLY